LCSAHYTIAIILFHVGCFRLSRVVKTYLIQPTRTAGERDGKRMRANKTVRKKKKYSVDVNTIARTADRRIRKTFYGDYWTRRGIESRRRIYVVRDDRSLPRRSTIVENKQKHGRENVSAYTGTLFVSRLKSQMTRRREIRIYENNGNPADTQRRVDVFIFDSKLIFYIYTDAPKEKLERNNILVPVESCLRYVYAYQLYVSRRKMVNVLRGFVLRTSESDKLRNTTTTNRYSNVYFIISTIIEDIFKKTVFSVLFSRNVSIPTYIRHRRRRYVFFGATGER